MKTFYWGVMLAVLVAATAGSGLVQGRLSRRWQTPEDYAPAVKSVADLPKQVGDWEMVEERKLADNVCEMLECMNYVYRTYKHVHSGESVTMALLLGPPGPISVHTPEICYPAKNYKIKADRKKVVIRTRDGKEDAFWTLDLQSKGVHGTGLRVAYAWRGNAEWDASEQPRFAYLAKPYLYKIQLAAESRAGAPIENDAVSRFLADLLPALDGLTKP